MEPQHDSLRSRAPVASSALLSAALGGLLSLAPGCAPKAEQPEGGTITDSGASVEAAAEASVEAGVEAGTEASAPVDASPLAEAGVPADTSAPVDASAPSDASAPADASAPVDASAPLDATPVDAIAAPDATPDAGFDAGPDAVADAAGPDVGCDIVPDRVITYSDAGMGITLTTFRARCDAMGGFIEVHPHCGGANTCGGFSYDETTGIYTEHSCAGLNTCTGYTCVLTRR